MTSRRSRKPQMRFYTKQWLSGRLSDAEFDAVEVAAATHMARIQRSAPPPVYRLVSGEGFGGFHDGVLISATAGEPTTLAMCTGDLQHGYVTTTLEFRGADVAVRGRSLRRIVRGPFTEILYDELDVIDDHYEWRAVFSDNTVLAVAFSDVDIKVEPRADRYWGRRGATLRSRVLRRARRPFVRAYWSMRERLGGA